MSGQLKDSVRVDTALGFDAIFRPIEKGNTRQKLEVTRKWGEATLRFVGPNPLTVGDQSVLLAVLQIATDSLKDAVLPQDTVEAKRLEKMLGQTGRYLSDKYVLVATSFRQLAKLAKGNTGGPAVALVRSSLARLTETTVWVEQGKDKASARLVAWEVSWDEGVLLSVHWRLVNALCGKAYTQISMVERGALGTEAAKALHFLMSCHVNPGKSWTCELDSLQLHVWGPCPSREALRKRRLKLRSALKELGSLPSWTVKVEGTMTHVTKHSTSTLGVEHLPQGAANRSRRGRTVTNSRQDGHAPTANRSRASTAHPSSDAGSGALVDVSGLFNAEY